MLGRFATLSCYDKQISARVYSLLVSLLLCAGASQAATTQYYYDDLGRVVQSVRSDGSIHQYQYDANGNVLAINRVGPGTVSISALAPLIGHVGASVTIYGSGFSSTAADNQVRFGTVSAVVGAATATALVVSVPQGATTGPVSVTVGGVTATSSMSYVVRKPEITTFTPIAVASSGQVTLTGKNLNLVPGSTAISVGGTAASLVSISNTQAVVNVSSSGGSGLIEIATPYGNAHSAFPLIVAPSAIVPANVISTGAITANGSSQSVDVNQASRFGVLTFQADEGQYLSAQIAAIVANPPNASFSYSLYSPSNTQLASGGVSQNQRTIHFPRIPTTGTYLLVFGSGSGTVQLTVSLEVNALVESNGSPLSTATTIAAQSKALTFAGTAGDSLGLAITSLTTAPASQLVYLYVYQPNGGLWKQTSFYAGTVPGNQLELRNLPATGTYRIVVSPYAAATMSFGLTLSQHLSGTLSIDTPLSVSLAVAGQYAKLTFTATAGQTLALGASSIATVPTNKAMTLTVLNASGTQVASYGSTASPFVNLPNLAAGTYTVIVNAADAATATMQVTLASGVVGLLPIDGSTSTHSTTVKGQRGYLTFEGTAGESLGLAITGLTTVPAGQLVYLYVYQPSDALWKQTSFYAGTVPGNQLELRNLPATGTYQIIVQPYSAVTMSFGLTLSQHLSGTLNLDVPLSLNLAVAGQYAKLTFTATAGQTLALGAGSIATVPTNKAMTLTVLNASGTQVASYGSTASPFVNLPNLTAGSYTVIVNTADAATATAQVTLASGVVGLLPIDGSTSTYSTTVKGQKGHFTFAGTAGESLGLAITSLTTVPASQLVYVSVYQPNGTYWNQVGCYAGTLPGCQLELRNLPVTGTYQIIVSPYSAATMSFGLTLSQHLSGTLNLDVPLSLNLAVAGQYAKLTFTATAGQTLALSAGSIATVPTNRTVWLTVLNASGTQVASSGSNASPNVNLTNLAAGTYTVIVNTADAASATMQVTLASGVVGLLPVDGSTSTYSTTVKGQKGYFTFAGTAGESLGLAITSLATEPASQLVYVSVYQPNGTYWNQVGCYAGTLPGCQLELRNLPVTGTYQIVVAPYSAATMSFGLTLSPHLSGTLSLDTPLSVNLAVPGQHAKLTFTATAGQTLALGASSIATVPTNRTVWLTVLNASGTQVGSSGSSVSPNVNLANLAAGTYTVIVNTANAASATMQVTLH